MTAGPGTLLGKYRLVSLLGVGGMAEVWSAKNLGAAGFERTVVVKRVLPHLARDTSFVSMFIAEAQLSALLHHPNIVQIFELGEHAGEFFLVLEFVDGYDLGRIMRALHKQPRELPISFAAWVVRDICYALGYAHAFEDDQGTALKIVHRDVSPSNVLVGKEGSVKLLDFGVAKAFGGSFEHRTRTGSLKGKVAYMSPEQADGLALDHRSDLFATGVILYELLTTRRLFKAENELATLALVRQTSVVPPSHLNPAVPPALDEICLRALAHDTADRFATGEEMAEALDVFARGWMRDSMRRLLVDLFRAEEEEKAALATQTRRPPEDEVPTSPTIASGEMSPARSSQEGGRVGALLRPRNLVIAGALVLSAIGLVLRGAPARPVEVAPAVLQATAAPIAPPASEPTLSAAPAPSVAPPAPSPEAVAPPKRREIVRPAPAKRKPKKGAAKKEPKRPAADFNPDSAVP